MKKTIIHWTNNLKMRNKLMVTYILIVMVPVLIIGAGVVGYFRSQAMDGAVEQATNNVERVKTRLGGMLRIPLDISNSLLIDRHLETTVTTRYNSTLELTKAYLSFEGFERYRRLYREINNVSFYYNNPTLTPNLELFPVNDQISSSFWFSQAMSTRNVHWFYIHDADGIPVNKLSLIRQIPFPDRQSAGVLMVTLNQRELNTLLSQEPFETVIADERGYVVAAKNRELIGLTLDNLDYGTNVGQLDKGTYRRQIHGKPFYMVVDGLTPSSSANTIHIISVFNTEEIMKNANRTSLIGFILTLSVLIIALFFVYVVSILITNRLQRLSRHLNQVAVGNLNVVSSIDGKDEIGQLSHQFNHMVSSINRLMIQVIEKTEQNNALELAQREIKLKMMASQINPHFLFNALESIRMNALIRGEKEIANVVRLLGKLMRKSLEVGRDNVALKDEIEMVQSYLDIQKFRYEERLNYVMDIDSACDSLCIPPLIIQPLVENAVIHGMEDQEAGVQVELSIHSYQDGMKVTVRDNGSGMTEKRLFEVNQIISRPEETGKERIGLRNVHQRLVLTYGEASGLHIHSEYGTGTVIWFVIPWGNR